MIPASEVLNDRFWAKVNKGEQCWTWTASLYGNGYGCFWDATQKRRVLAHRFSYATFVGEIPEGLQVDHMCHTRHCVRPDHLRLATNKQNMENLDSLRSDNTTGYRGVERHGKNGLYRAVVEHHGVRHRLFPFNTPEEAHDAARKLRLELFTHNDADRAATPKQAFRNLADANHPLMAGAAA